MYATESLKEARLNKSISLLKKWLFWLLAFVGMAVLVSVYFGEIREQTELTDRSDFYKFYLSSSNLLQDKPVYWPAPDRASPTSHCNPDVENKFRSGRIGCNAGSHQIVLASQFKPTVFYSAYNAFRAA